MLRLRMRNAFQRLVRASVTSFAILIGAILAAVFLGGLEDRWIVVTVLLMIVSFFTLAVFPRTRIPEVSDLRNTPLPQLADRTILWLETNRASLPPGAQRIVGRLEGDLDLLSPQLARIDERHPAAREVRKLLDEHLPSLVESYKRIPAPYRTRDHAGSTPDQQLVEGLQVVAREVEAMTGEIARGELDALATRGRYLELRYVEGEQKSDV